MATYIMIYYKYRCENIRFTYENMLLGFTAIWK